MYICICKAVTSSQIQQELIDVEQCTVQKINERLGCGNDCGRCRSSIKQMIQESKIEGELES